MYFQCFQTAAGLRVNNRISNYLNLKSFKRWAQCLAEIIKEIIDYGTAQMQCRTRSRSPNASASTLDDKRGVAPTSLMSIHPMRYEINTRIEMGDTFPQTATIYALTIDSLSSAGHYIWVVL